MKTKNGLTAALILLFSSQLFATNGYFMHGTGSQEKGLAGAAVATSWDSMSVASNPASILDVGDRLDGGLAIFAPFRTFNVDGAPSQVFNSPNEFTFSLGDGQQEIKSGKNYFPVPQVGWTRQLDENRAINLAMWGQGGMNTHWQGGSAWMGPNRMNGAFGGGTTGVDLSQAFAAFTYAMKLRDNHQIGISMIGVIQRFEIRGINLFGGFSSSPLNVSNKGHDKSRGFGFKFGYQLKATEQLTIGAGWRPKIEMSRFEDYSGLYADAGRFDIPSNMQLGIAWKTGNHTFTVEGERILYSEVDAIGNPFSNLYLAMGGAPQFALGGPKGPGFGYRDMNVIKLGYEEKVSDSFTWRAGFSNTKQPIPDSEILFAVLAPAIMEEHITLGFTNKVSDTMDWSLSFMYAPEVKISAPNPLDPAQVISTEMDEFELAVAMGRKF